MGDSFNASALEVVLTRACLCDFSRTSIMHTLDQWLLVNTVQFATIIGPSALNCEGCPLPGCVRTYHSLLSAGHISCIGYLCVCVYICMCVCIYIRICVCVCVCVYIYVPTHPYTYYTHTHTSAYATPSHAI